MCELLKWHHNRYQNYDINHFYYHKLFFHIYINSRIWSELKICCNENYSFGTFLIEWPEIRGYIVLGSVMLSVPARCMHQVQVKGHVILDFEFCFTKLLLKDGVDFPDLLAVVRVQFLVQIPASRDTCVLVPLLRDLSECVLDIPHMGMPENR